MQCIFGFGYLGASKSSVHPGSSAFCLGESDGTWYRVLNSRKWEDHHLGNHGESNLWISMGNIQLRCHLSEIQVFWVTSTTLCWDDLNVEAQRANIIQIDSRILFYLAYCGSLFSDRAEWLALHRACNSRFTKPATKPLLQRLIFSRLLLLCQHGGSPG